MNLVKQITTNISRGRAKYNTRNVYEEGSVPTEDMIFVFPSDLSLPNSKDLARLAMHNYGASYYQNYGFSKGPTGRAYAIPVADEGVPFGRDELGQYVRSFMEFTQRNFINNGAQFFLCDFTRYIAPDVFEEVAYNFKHCYGAYYPVSFVPYLESTKEDNANSNESNEDRIHTGSIL